MNKELIKKYKKEFDYWMEGVDIITKFKVGDWVRKYDKYSNDTDIIQIDEALLESIVNENTYNTFELWQPKENEWCWFWWDDGDMLTPALGKFKGTTKDSENNTIYLCESMFQDYIDDGDLTIQFDSCEPFFGELPTFLKEKQ